MDVQATAGKPFDISVEQLGTAGYQWSVDSLPSEVALVVDRTAPPPSGSPPGTAACRVFTFRADRPGDYQIVLTCKRVWEDQPLSRRVVRVEVR